MSLSAPLTDAFPAGLVVAASPNTQNTCGGGLTAVPGSDSITLDAAGSVIPAAGFCWITVDVSASAPGSYANTIPPGALQTSGGSNASSADATLAVNLPPTLAKQFVPAIVTAGSPSTLTITLGNANASGATLGAPLTDAFPVGLLVAGTPNASTTCGGTLTAVPGSDSITLDASGSTIPGAGTCTVTVDVQANTPNDYANSIGAGALQTDVGANTTSADATLSVTP